MSKELVKQDGKYNPALNMITNENWREPKNLDVIFRLLGHDGKFTDDQKRLFLDFSIAHGANPLKKQVYFTIIGKTAVPILAYTFICAKVNAMPDVEGITAVTLREHDSYDWDFETGILKHKMGFKNGSRGAVIGAWGIVYRKGKKPAIRFADIKDYEQLRYDKESRKLKRSGVWAKSPGLMAEKSALSLLIRSLFKDLNDYYDPADFPIEDIVKIEQTASTGDPDLDYEVIPITEKPKSKPIVETPKPEPITDKQKARIHIILKEKQLPDDKYRHSLKNKFGVESSKEMSSGAADELIKILNSLPDPEVIVKIDKTGENELIDILEEDDLPL